jgi:sterol desaturase/sphingolipid hydroxylase (fatty acid hydroxylase superfamily)
MADPVTLIQATLAPIFLVNGAAIFLNFTQARLFRVIDRLRALAKEAREGTDEAARAVLLRDRDRHVRRALILRNAILFGVLVIALTVVTTLLLLSGGVDPALAAGPWPVVTFAAALVAFFVALVLVTTDAFLSVAAARHITDEFDR